MGWIMIAVDKSEDKATLIGKMAEGRILISMAQDKVGCIGPCVNLVMNWCEVHRLAYPLNKHCSKCEDENGQRTN